jgi:hypothetical protein
VRRAWLGSRKRAERAVAVSNRDRRDPPEISEPEISMPTSSINRERCGCVDRGASFDAQ